MLLSANILTKLAIRLAIKPYIYNLNYRLMWYLQTTIRHVLFQENDFGLLEQKVMEYWLLFVSREKGTLFRQSKFTPH